VRVSTISFRAENYNIYYRPKRYAFSDVLASIKEARSSGLFVSVNLLTFPGFTDSQSEVDHLVRFLKKGYVDLLQLRNLSIDAELFKNSGLKTGSGVLGIRKTADLLKDEIKGLKLGYFNQIYTNLTFE
jgi:molybdenum cofactor biosynthesis enzyme MoaA